MEKELPKTLCVGAPFGLGLALAMMIGLNIKSA